MPTEEANKEAELKKKTKKDHTPPILNYSMVLTVFALTLIIGIYTIVLSSKVITNLKEHKKNATGNLEQLEKSQNASLAILLLAIIAIVIASGGMFYLIYSASNKAMSPASATTYIVFMILPIVGAIIASFFAMDALNKYAKNITGDRYLDDAQKAMKQMFWMFISLVGALVLVWIIYIVTRGMTLRKPTKLDEELQEIMDEAKKIKRELGNVETESDKNKAMKHWKNFYTKINTKIEDTTLTEEQNAELKLKREEMKNVVNKLKEKKMSEESEADII